MDSNSRSPISGDTPQRPSPELVEAILQGRQPVALTATRLTELDLPLDWTEQQKLLAG